MRNKEHDHIWVYVSDFSCKGYWIDVESCSYHWEVLQMSVFILIDLSFEQR